MGVEGAQGEVWTPTAPLSYGGLCALIYKSIYLGRGNPYSPSIDPNAT